MSCASIAGMADPVTESKLDTLDLLASEATQGVRAYVDPWVFHYQGGRRWKLAEVVTWEGTTADAAFIAECDPATVRALTRIARKARELLDDDDMPVHWDDCACSYCVRHLGLSQALGALETGSG